MKMRIKYTMISPVSHIGETASTGSYFQTVNTSFGRLPIITGNSVRGILRDYGAIYLLDIMQSKVDKEIFNILFSGGNLNGTLKNDVAKAKAVRENIPFISLFGGGLGDMIMSGKIFVGNLYPLTEETYEMLGEEYTDISWRNLIDEMSFTRTDDGKNDTLTEYMIDPTEETKAKASTQMRFTVQYMAVGTEFVQDIHIMDNATDLEKGAFFTAVKKWWDTLPRLGGMSAKGFGMFDAVSDFGISMKNGELITTEEFDMISNRYENFIENSGKDVLSLLGSRKNGKK